MDELIQSRTLKCADGGDKDTSNKAGSQSVAALMEKFWRTQGAKGWKKDLRDIESLEGNVSLATGNGIALGNKDPAQ